MKNDYQLSSDIDNIPQTLTGQAEKAHRPMRTWISQLLAFALLTCLAHGQTTGTADPKPLFLATVPPLAMILQEIAGDRAEVACLLRGGASPHTYSPRPSDAAACARAIRIFMASPELEPWAADLAPAEKLIRAMTLLPAGEIIYFHHEHHHHAHDAELDDEHASHETMVADPHFWTDPLTVKSMLPAIAEKLAEADPAGAPIYRANAEKFAGALDTLAADTHQTLAPAKGRSVILFHPSFNYLLKRHGIGVAGLLEQVPGRTPTPREIVALSKTVKSAGVRAIFTEPQLPRRPAEVLAETAGVKLATLDPMGGAPGPATYSDLIRSNTRALAEALQ